MKVNFRIEDNYAVNYEGRHIDLHNNFDFSGYTYDSAQRQLTLQWVKSSGKWVPPTELCGLRLIHDNVSFLSIQFLSEEAYPPNECCLSDLTFFPSTHRTTNEGIIYQAVPTAEDDLLYIFQNEAYIRVGCTETTLVILSAAVE